MTPGRKTADPKIKSLMGTHRKDRHASIAPVAMAPSTAPIAPKYLTPEGRIVWDEEVKRVTAIGITETDSSFFARYCEMEASYRVAIMAGELPKAALLTELRRSAELLGIAGARSRLSKLSTTEPAVKSPFSMRPK